MSPVIHRWDPVSKSRVIERIGHTASVQSVAFCPTGRSVASSALDGKVLVWDVAEQKPRLQVSLPEGLRDAGCVRWLNLGNVLACGEGACWDASSGKQIRAFGTVDLSSPHWNKAVDFCEQSKLAAWTNYQNQIVVSRSIENRRDSSAETGLVLKEIHRFSPPADLPMTTALKFGPDSMLLASVNVNEDLGILLGFPVRMGDDRKSSIVVRHITSGAEVWRAANASGFFLSIDFSPNGKWLASGGEDGLLRIWDTRNGWEMGSIPANNGGVRVVAFSRDGKNVFTAGSDSQIHVFEASTLKERVSFSGHRGAINSLDISSDGKSLVSGGDDTTLLLWDLSASKQTGFPLIALSDEVLEGLWSDLASADARKAYGAIVRIEQGGAKSVEFLKKRLIPAISIEKSELMALIQQLDNDSFKIRETAEAKLHGIVDLAEKDLRLGLSKASSPETRRRIEGILREAFPIKSVNKLQSMRALESLERVGGPLAVALLQRLGEGNPEAMLTQEAKLSLARLNAFSAVAK